jgi:hypothetical protein
MLSKTKSTQDLILGGYEGKGRGLCVVVHYYFHTTTFAFTHSLCLCLSIKRTASQKKRKHFKMVLKWYNLSVACYGTLLDANAHLHGTVGSIAATAGRRRLWRARSRILDGSTTSCWPCRRRHFIGVDELISGGGGWRSCWTIHTAKCTTTTSDIATPVTGREGVNGIRGGWGVEITRRVRTTGSTRWMN